MIGQGESRAVSIRERGTGRETESDVANPVTSPGWALDRTEASRGVTCVCTLCVYLVCVPWRNKLETNQEACVFHPLQW